ncbi:MAG: flagellar hook-basal body protein [Nitrospirales bacterium]|nr:flagellar hook-basal body protein [Nitrospira sp.]MDR4502329.1 flagellar hook-basal body protein [Nitrospirales bacterium]
MNRGIYPPLAGAISFERRLEVLSHNIGNVNTTGYKKDKPVFETILGAASARPYAGMDLFPRVGNIIPEVAQGALEQTGRELDVGLNGPGFFVVKTEEGNRHFRGGRLFMNESGQLVTHSGDPILGKKGPVTVPPGAISIDANGAISVNNLVIDQLRIEDIPATETPVKAGDLYWNIPAQVIGAPNTTVQQGMLEKSNINPGMDLVELIKVTRAYEQMQKAIQTMDQLASQVIQVARVQA